MEATCVELLICILFLLLHAIFLYYSCFLQITTTKQLQ